MKITVEATAGSGGPGFVPAALADSSTDRRGRDKARPSQSQVLSDLLVGEVWYVSGQSNAECPLWGPSPRFRDRNGALTAQMTKRPLVRMCYASNYRTSAVPKAFPDYPVEWERFDRASLGSGHSFSAMGAYFALELHAALGIPVGVVGSYYGGTTIEPWIPAEGYESVGLHPPACVELSGGNQRPCALWNEMVSPFAPMAMRGFLWYQGCSNRRHPERYCERMHALYNGWAKAFENPSLKLYYVQIAAWADGGHPEFQQAQARFETEQPNAAMAVINDLANLTDIHPNEKYTVAKRLLVHALRRDYGYSDIRDNSPTLRSWRIEDGKFVLSFNDADSFYIYNQRYCSRETGFELAGADGVWKPAIIANQKITQKSWGPAYLGDIDSPELVVEAEGVKEPKRLRYLYSRPWYGAVYNEVGLPLGSFFIDGDAGSELHWRVTDLAGNTVEADAPAARIPKTGGKCEMWIRSPKNQIGGAYISFAGCGCAEPERLQNADWRDQPRWNRHLASVKVNGTDYFPLEDERACLLPITLFEGWNHVELSIPEVKGDCPLADFAPVFEPAFGTVEKRRPIPGLVCRAVPPEIPRIELQPKIDAAAAAGGGTVTVPAGDWLTGPIVLRSNVTLKLEDGARLNATTDIGEYDPRVCHRHFIYAENATNVAIVGRGVLDGHGGGFREQKGLKGQSQPQALVYMMRFSRCRNLRLEDFTYQRGGAWGCHLRNCDGVVIRGLTCFNHANKTNDGIDIESSNVLVENCVIDADDDAIVIKSESDPSFAVTNITVRNCRLASCCYAFKFGTGSWGDFRDVKLEDTVFFRPQGNYRFKWRDTVPGDRNDLLGSSGFGIDIVDGGRLDGFTLRNVVMEDGYQTHSFIRLGGRNTDPDGKESFLRNVLIEDYRGVTEGRIAASVTGIPGRRVRDVVFRNLDFRLAGGGTAEDAAGPIPESIGRYPGIFMFDAKLLPAHGFFIRHADNIRFENVGFTLAQPDVRPPYATDDVTGFSVR